TRLTAAMVDLGNEARALGLDGLHHGTERFRLLHAPETELARVRAPARFDRMDLRDDQTDAAAGTRDIKVLKQRRGRTVRAGEIRAHRRHEDAVSDLQPADPRRREEQAAQAGSPSVHAWKPEEAR